MSKRTDAEMENPMASDSNMHPDEDIRQALESAAAKPGASTAELTGNEPLSGAIATNTSNNPVFYASRPNSWPARRNCVRACWRT